MLLTQIPNLWATPTPPPPAFIQSGESLSSCQSRPSAHESARTSRPRARSLWNGGPLFGDFPIHQTATTVDRPQYDSDHFHYARRALSFLFFHQHALYRLALQKNNVKQSPPESIVDIVSSAARISPGVVRLTSVIGYPNVLLGTAKRFQNSTLGQSYELVLPHNGFPSAFASAFVCDTVEEHVFSRKFKSFVLQFPEFAQDIVNSADPRGLVGRMLPSGLVPPGARYIAACFWAWLCIIDDLTEESDSLDSLEQCVVALSGSPYAPPLGGDSDCIRIMNALRHAVNTTTLYPVKGRSSATTVESWKSHFWREVLVVVKALQAEKGLQGRNFSLREWMDLRQLTISARPFMVLVRASLGLPCNLDYGTDRTSDDRIHQVQTLVQSVLGLQNDLLGWEKDHKTKNPLNAVEVLIRDGMEASDAYSEVLQSHNNLMRVLLQVAQQLMFSSTEMMQSAGFLGHEVYLFAMLANLRITVGFGSAMAEWMLSSRRYVAEKKACSVSALVPDADRFTWHRPLRLWMDASVG
ncbi:MAG: hypothetical protein M1839_008571 [Geoglossum umbratile]|nr:MAG: hypothetical protein M1839_008571 [Geoglossum umbratile]